MEQQSDASLERWAEAFRQASDNDAELQANGKYYSCRYMLDAEKHRVVIHMHEGRVESIAIDPGDLDAPYQFAIRASAETWSKFAQPTPPPMYHGIWSASFRSGMRLEGDLLPMFQNLACLTHQLELLRATGAPIA